MGRIKFDDDKPLIKNKGFYIALAVCLVALGVSSYTAMTKIREYDTPASSVPDSTSSFSEVDKTVSDVPYPTSSVAAAATPTDATTSDDSVLTQAAPFFTLPVTGEILKDFDSKNLQYSETFKDWRLHLGVDIAASKGTVVLSCAQGVVEEIYADPSLGTVVAIDHGDGLMAYYCGLNAKPTVQIGDSVESGSQLGVIEGIPTESVEQPHLHLEMEKDGVPVSPLQTMNMMQ